MEEVERRRDSKLSIKKGGESDQQQLLRVKKKALQTVLEQCQTALELLRSTDDGVDLVGNDDEQIEEEICEGSCSGSGDSETDELCNLLKSGVDSPDFLEKLGSVHVLVPQSNAEEGNSWDVVSENDFWEGGNMESDQESYVLVRQEDIMEGIACYTAAYLLSLQQTKELTPNQLQEALSKTFSVKKRKGKLQKVWDGSKVIYNVASWGATAIGIYQNPALLKAASSAFWTSCHVISKLSDFRRTSR